VPVSRPFNAFVAAALLSAPASVAAEEADQTKRACAAAYEQTQRFRQDGKLVEAREQAVRCAQTACPALLTSDCAHWVEELDQALPTVVIDARDEAGKQLRGVRVVLDGRTLSAEADGVAFTLNPGPHRFRFQAAGRTPAELEEVIVQGRKNQRLQVELKPSAQTPAAAQPARYSPWAYTTGSVGILGLSGFTYFGLIGNSRKKALESSCSPRCTDSDLAPMRRDYLVADAALVVGIVAVATTAILLLEGRSQREEAAAAHAASARR
jgi:hypothetical protein